MKRKTVSIIGPSHYNCSYDVYNFGIELGKLLFEEGYSIVCGGLGGIMEAVCKGAKQATGGKGCLTIGIIPGIDKSESNEYCDIVIPTGLGIARNPLVVNSGDIVISVAGETGTLTELGIALQIRKPIIVLTNFSSMASDFIQSVTHPQYEGLIHKVDGLENLKICIKSIYTSFPKK